VVRQGYAPQERTVSITASRRERRETFTLTRRAAAGTGAKPSTGAPAAKPGAAAPRPAPAAVSSISIETRPPGARVRLDGKDAGVAPITLSPVTAGTHTVELVLPGYRAWTTTVTVVAGQRQRVTASLERDTPR
jgi:serine/threonine-protein kinase